MLFGRVGGGRGVAGYRKRGESLNPNTPPHPPPSPVLHRHPLAPHANLTLGRCLSCKSHVAIFVSLSNLRPFPPPAPADRAAGGGTLIGRPQECPPLPCLCLRTAIKAALACGDSAFHSPVSSAPLPACPADMAAAHRLVIVRHGESAWNQENRFCGWFDADLSEKGVEEARRGALAIKEAGLKFDVCYTSVLKRAVKTLWTIMEGTDQMWLPVIRTWRLNERHYGGLTGLNKAETAEKHGEEQVKIWRRSFDIPPPPMDADHAYHKIISQVRSS